jgi:2,3-diketo-5-methylthio-1-phosphopentane phosphatase
MPAAPPLTVICDFDGTITHEDVGAALCARFAPGVLERVDARWTAGEISFAEAYRLACLELKATHAVMVAHAMEIGRVRDGFSELVDACRRTGTEMVIASAGLDLYVEPILARCLGARRADVEVCVNLARVGPEGLHVDFPHRDEAGAECGNCKGRRARRARSEGRRVIAVGDSFSDCCLVEEADAVFARGWLAGHCRDRAIAHETFDDFAPVTSLVESLGSRGH